MKDLFVILGALWLGVLAALLYALLWAMPDPEIMRLAAYSIAGWDFLAFLAAFGLKRADYGLY